MNIGIVVTTTGKNDLDQDRYYGDGLEYFLYLLCGCCLNWISIYQRYIWHRLWTCDVAVYDISNNIQYVRDYFVTKIVIERKRYYFRLRIYDDIIQYNRPVPYIYSRYEQKFILIWCTCSVHDKSRPVKVYSNKVITSDVQIAVTRIWVIIV